ncbi:MAG: LLM class flavin-dependent oxidoreductase [Clostridium sp.]|uniref:LLM class flavin-dependent oxidoreductase n=1 Tax=Clostridium sp. TaxID=1506 RepID=UPI0039967F6F
MSLKNDLKSYIAKKGWSITDIQKELNKRNGTNFTPQNLVKKINNETIKYSELLEIADIIGYNIEWVEKNDSEK